MRKMIWIAPLLLSACASALANDEATDERASHAGASEHDASFHKTAGVGEECKGGVCPLPPELLGTAPAASSWSIEDMQGKQLDVDATLASGRSVAFVFWQTWCGSCREEFPSLIAAAQKYESGIEIVGVVSGPDGVIDDDEVRATVKQFGLTYRQVRDRDLSLTRRFEVTGTPTIVVVGKGQKTLYRGHRAPEDWTQFSQ
ncbi:MAG: thiol-disulfide isomerase/thioredoxin [Planctomycetota bacterium]|jgi:thiol-disulfide isomerase/thioredoxin